MKTEKLASFAAVVLLSACGADQGSSASGSSATTAPASGSSPPPALQSAPAPAEPFNVQPTTLTATVNGVTYTATYSITPNNGTTPFNGQTANSSTVSVTVQQNGTTLASQTTTEYYLPNPFTLLGIAGTTGNTSYTLPVDVVNPLPSTLTVGDSGTLFSGNYMATNGSSTVLGVLTQRYAVSAGNANSLTLTIAGNGTLNGQTVIDSAAFAVDSTGKITLQSVEILVNGQTYTFTVPMSMSM